jgi:PAS domain-containing protein
MGPALLSIRSYLPEGSRSVQHAWSAFSVLVLLFGVTQLVAAGRQVWPDLMLVHVTAKTVTAAWAAGTAFYFLFHLHDGIVEAFQVLRELRRADAERAIAARDHHTFQGAPTGMLYVDWQGRVVEANQCFADWLRTTPERIEGRLFTDFVFVEDVPSATRRFSQVVNGVQPEGLVPSDTRFVARDGSVVDLWWQRGTGRVGEWVCLRFAATAEAALPPPPKNGKYVKPLAELA